MVYELIFHRIYVEICQSKMSNFFCEAQIATFYCSSQVVNPNFFRLGTTAAYGQVFKFLNFGFM